MKKIRIKKRKLSLKKYKIKRKHKGSTAKQRRSKKYLRWRVAVFRRDRHTCKKCGQKGGHLNAHHFKPWALFPESRFDINNGITLCSKCHTYIHKVKDPQFLYKL